jgi:hypothetical protein
MANILPAPFKKEWSHTGRNDKEWQGTPWLPKALRRSMIGNIKDLHEI